MEFRDMKHMTGKEKYEERKRLKSERLLRSERKAAEKIDGDEEGLEILCTIAVSLERLADALEVIAGK